MYQNQAIKTKQNEVRFFARYTSNMIEKNTEITTATREQKSSVLQILDTDLHSATYGFQQKTEINYVTHFNMISNSYLKMTHFSMDLDSLAHVPWYFPFFGAKACQEYSTTLGWSGLVLPVLKLPRPETSKLQALL